MTFPDFVWSCGEEGSDPVVHYQGRDLRVDQFTASGHDQPGQAVADMKAVASLGVGHVRYGAPWRMTERSPGWYDWRRWDRAMAACEEAELVPVVDLCHFGLPDHLGRGGFRDRRWVFHFERYVEAFLHRYRHVRFFTPVNEPGITALFSTRFGWWNDRSTDGEGCAQALANAAEANLAAMARVRADRDGWWIASEGFSAWHDGENPVEHDERIEDDRDWDRAIWDLQLGHPPGRAVERHLRTVPEAQLVRINALVSKDRVIAGHDLYPVSIRGLGVGADQLTIEQRLEAYHAEARRFHSRYDLPFWVAETSNLGLPVKEQTIWLTALTSKLGTMRAEGLPVRGLCWYSRGDQYDWDTALREPVGRVTEVGLWDAQRHPRPVVETFRRLVAAGPARPDPLT